MACTSTLLRHATRRHSLPPAGMVLRRLPRLLAVAILCTACQALEPPENSPTASAPLATALPAAAPTPATPPRTSPAAPTKEPSALPTTMPLISPAPSKIVIVQAPSSITLGDTATVIARVPSETACSLLVGYKDSSLMTQELAPIQSNTPGLIAWSWQVGPQTPRGAWPLTIVCGNLSATVSITVR
jgi:hypothetical protein